jgi:ketosteroid isomerase-like protein
MCRDGLIWKVRNFTDTLHADRLFGLDNKTPTAS